MTDPIPIGEDDLQSYLDRRLPPERMAVVAAWLAAHPDMAARADRYAQQEAMLMSALRDKFEEPVPASLRVTNIIARRRHRMGAQLARVAAVLLLLGSGCVAGWYAREWSAGRNSLHAATTNAVAAFTTFSVETRHPVEVRADDEPHLVQWLSNRLHQPVAPPDLSTQGFRLMGGRVLPTANVPAALLMYDDDHGTRLTVYIQPMGIDGTDFRYAETDGVRTVFWAERRMVCAVTGRTSQPLLLAVAGLVREQMARTADTELRDTGQR